MARYPTIFSPGSLIGAGAGDPFLALHREMNRLFDDVLRGNAPGGQERASGGGGAGSGVMLAPHMDVSETDKEVRIRAEMPGVADKDIEVSLDDDVLTIRAEKRQERREEREGVHVSERAFGTFQRSVRVPFPVNPDQVRADFENGVLTVTLPKAQPEEKTRRIQVQGTSRLGGGQGGSQGSSERNATEMPQKMSASSDQPGQGGTAKGSTAGQSGQEKPVQMPKTMGDESAKPSFGFKDPLPPGTDSKSGPGSSGPV